MKIHLPHRTKKPYMWGVAWDGRDLWRVFTLCGRDLWSEPGVVSTRKHTTCDTCARLFDEAV